MIDRKAINQVEMRADKFACLVNNYKVPGTPVVLFFSSKQKIAFMIFQQRGKKHCSCIVRRATNKWCLDVFARVRDCQYPRSKEHAVILLNRYWPADPGVNVATGGFYARIGA